MVNSVMELCVARGREIYIGWLVGKGFIIEVICELVFEGRLGICEIEKEERGFYVEGIIRGIRSERDYGVFREEYVFGVLFR